MDTVAFVCANNAPLLVAAQFIDELTAGDQDLHDHSYATAILAAHILAAQGKAPAVCARGFIAGLLHDAGIVSVGPHAQPDVPGEWRALQSRLRRATHATLAMHPQLEPFAQIAAGVHNEIPRSSVARAVIVADQYDVLTRAWEGAQPHCTPAAALDALRAAAGWKYDERAIRALEASYSPKLI